MWNIVLVYCVAKFWVDCWFIVPKNGLVLLVWLVILVHHSNIGKKKSVGGVGRSGLKGLGK